MESPDLILHAARRYPERACIIAGDSRVTFAEVDGRAQRLVRAWERAGLQRADRVALLAFNELEYVEIRVAAQRGQMMFVPLNYRLALSELKAIIDDCRPRLLIYGPGFEKVARELTVPMTWALPSASGDGEYRRALGAPEDGGPYRVLSGDAPSLICYTSGSTGRPKGVVLTNGASHAGLTAMGHEIGARPEHVFLTAAPLFHIGAHVSYAFTYLGATCIQVAKFGVADVAAALQRHSITHTQLLPTMIQILLREVHSDEIFRSLKRVLYGASPMSPQLLTEALRRMGCEFVNGYGMTEALGISCLPPEEHRPEDRPDLLSSVGRSGISQQVRVVDHSGMDVPAGVVGEIICHGPSMMLEYWEDSVSTAKTIRDGWLYTGDLGYRSSEGFLFLVDRLHDRIITGGENVYPREVEDVLLMHPGISEVAVVGLPDSVWGQRVHAAIVPKMIGTVTQQQVIQFARAHLASYKIPKSIEFVNTLPKTATGKLARSRLRDLHKDEHSG